MTPQELKNSILQLAIQGKLVPQRAEEGNAEDLYKQIQAEKQKLIKEGKIKKEKPLPPITDDEKPFEIPKSWKWVRLGEIFQHNTGKALNSSDKVGIKKKYITTSNLYWNRFELENVREMYFSNNEIEKCLVKKGDLLVCEGGDIGRAAIWNYDYEICLQNHIHRLRSYVKINTKYFYYIFYFYKNTNKIGGKGIAIKGLSSMALHILFIPLPPLAEQKRIVAKIEEFLPYVERYETAYNKLQQLNKHFPDDLQKSVLQLAIQGRLVPQYPEEGNAEDLYKQIHAEKQKLIKEGKIKKEKPLPPITDDEKPFEIPESWKWVRLGEVIDVRDGTHDTPEYIPHGYPLITGKDFYNGYFDLNKTQYISYSDFIEISKRSKVEINDILFSMIGGNIGSMILISENNYFDMAIKNIALFKQYNSNLLFPKYLFYFLKSQISEMKRNAKGGAQMFVSLNLLRKYHFPLPPLAEQKRIVAKIEELLPLCDKLK